MRFEVKGFGVDVVLIQPGLITTEFATAAVGALNTGTTDDGPYAEFNQAWRPGRLAPTRVRWPSSEGRPRRLRR